MLFRSEAREVFGIEPGDTLLVLGDSKKGLAITKKNAIEDVAMKILDGLD